MRADAIIGMEQHFLATAVDAYALVFGEILEECPDASPGAQAR
jgi:hypothetical protein